MTRDQITSAINSGERVNWKNITYRIVINKVTGDLYTETDKHRAYLTDEMLEDCSVYDEVESEFGFNPNEQE